MARDDHSDMLNVEFSYTAKVAPLFFGRPEKYREYLLHLKRWKIQADDNTNPEKLAIRAIARMKGRAEELVKMLDEEKLAHPGQIQSMYTELNEEGEEVEILIDEIEDGWTYLIKSLKEEYEKPEFETVYSRIRDLMAVKQSNNEDIEDYINRFKVN